MSKKFYYTWAETEGWIIFYYGSKRKQVAVGDDDLLVARTPVESNDSIVWMLEQHTHFEKDLGASYIQFIGHVHRPYFLNKPNNLKRSTLRR